MFPVWFISVRAQCSSVVCRDGTRCEFQFRMCRRTGGSPASVSDIRAGSCSFASGTLERVTAKCTLALLASHRVCSSGRIFGSSPDHAATENRRARASLPYGVQHLDERLVGLALPESTECAIMPTHAHIAERIVNTWSRAYQSPGSPAIILYGPDTSSARSIAASVCLRLGLDC